VIAPSATRGLRHRNPLLRLGKAVGHIVVVVALSSAGSLSAVAAILSVGSRRWLFLVSVPIGAAALLKALRSLPDTPRSARALDPKSIILNTLT
jgi:MFS transporter, DHA2 family, multidrug resistance protein